MVIRRIPIRSSLTVPRLEEITSAVATDRSVQKKAVSTPVNRLFHKLVRYPAQTSA